MVEEVADAVDWVAESCPHTSAGRVSLVGHSAGAQLCLMALLKLIDPARHLNGRKRRLPARYIGERSGGSAYFCQPASLHTAQALPISVVQWSGCKAPHQVSQ